MRSSSFLCSLLLLLLPLLLHSLSTPATSAAPTPSSHVHFDTGGLSRESFKKGFIWGVSTSAYQIEGMAHKAGRGPSIWDTFVKIPGSVIDNSSGEVATDHYNRYIHDVDMIEKFNFDAYRFSFSWSRIFPNGRGKVNWEGVDFYNRLIDYLLHRGITPYVTLYHQDFPDGLQKEYNGWLDRKAVTHFAEYADFCFKTFGNRVKHWMTINEPKHIAASGHDDGTFPPGRCSNCTHGNSATEPYIVTHNLLLAHASAVQIYREKYQATQKGNITIVLDVTFYEPHNKSRADDVRAAQRARDFHLGWYLHPIIYGEYPKIMKEVVGHRLPKFNATEVKMVKGSIDYLGINHYTTYFVKAAHRKPSPPTSYHDDWNIEFAFERNGVPIGEMAQSSWFYIVPWGMYKTLTYIKEHYGDPTIMITENGFDEPGHLTLPKALHDTRRINFYKSYLTELKRAVDDGAHVIGYFAWSLLDNFEWAAGYTSRFGIVYVDFNDLKRYPKMSAYWFKLLLAKKKP